jgi:hypothetical protein
MEKEKNKSENQDEISHMIQKGVGKSITAYQISQALVQHKPNSAPTELKVIQQNNDIPKGTLVNGEFVYK